VKTRALVAGIAVVALVALAAAGCAEDEADGGPTYRDDPKALNIDAGSEQDKVLRRRRVGRVPVCRPNARGKTEA
jgi:hypothetical protein